MTFIISTGRVRWRVGGKVPDSLGIGEYSFTRISSTKADWKDQRRPNNSNWYPAPTRFHMRKFLHRKTELFIVSARVKKEILPWEEYFKEGRRKKEEGCHILFWMWKRGGHVTLSPWLDLLINPLDGKAGAEWLNFRFSLSLFFSRTIS